MPTSNDSVGDVNRMLPLYFASTTLLAGGLLIIFAFGSRLQASPYVGGVWDMVWSELPSGGANPGDRMVVEQSGVYITARLLHGGGGRPIVMRGKMHREPQRPGHGEKITIDLADAGTTHHMKVIGIAGEGQDRLMAGVMESPTRIQWSARPAAAGVLPSVPLGR